METPSILGVVFGVAIGGLYVGWQARDLRRQKQAAPDGKVLALAPGAMLRLVVTLAALWAVLRFTDADKWWLTGSLLVTYSLPLVWQVRNLFPPRGTKS